MTADTQAKRTKKRKPKIRYLGDVQRLRLKPGDCVVLSTDRLLTPKQADFIRTRTMEHLGGGIPIIILAGGFKIELLERDHP